MFPSLSHPPELVAQAAFIEYSDRIAFESAVSGIVSFDFETTSGFPAAPAQLDIIDATIDLSTSGGDSAVYVQSYGAGWGQGIGGSVSDEINNFTAVVVAFSAPYYAVGFDNLDLTLNEDAIINVVFGSGSFTFKRTDPDPDFSNAPFFGIWAGEPILGLRVWSGNAPTDQPGSRANLIDNLSVSRTPSEIPDVPEPSTFWLTSAAGLGLMLLGRLRPR